MQVLDEKKRARIIQAATELFATEPFRKVLLSQVAAAAGVGKGTLYVYFKSKEDLYIATVQEGFLDLVDCLNARLGDQQLAPPESLAIVIRELVHFACRNPHVFQLMRTVPDQTLDQPAWEQKRRELRGLIESIIRRGIECGIYDDPHPELTAVFIPGMVRSTFHFDGEEVDEEALTQQITRLVSRALCRK
ncbi:TetR/AcrR family transcriptional regulator [bacterium]|nr:TetR/AcrR family transcriptional regulator [bacterium]